MNKRTAFKQSPANLARSILVGLGVGLTVCVLGTIIITFLVNRETISLQSSGYGIMITLLIASYLMSALVLVKHKEKALLTSVLCAAVMFVMLIIINLLFFGGGTEGGFATGAVLLAGSVAAALLQIRPKKNRIYRPSKIGNR